MGWLTNCRPLRKQVDGRLSVGIQALRLAQIGGPRSCFFHLRAYLATANPTMMIQTHYFFGFYYFYATA